MIQALCIAMVYGTNHHVFDAAPPGSNRNYVAPSTTEKLVASLTFMLHIVQLLAITSTGLKFINAKHSHDAPSSFLVQVKFLSAMYYLHCTRSCVCFVSLEPDSLDKPTCSRLLTLATTCSRLQPLAHACNHLLTLATTCSRLQPLAHACNHLLTLATTCSRFAHVCRVTSRWF
jgi:hypothetical protein